MSNIISANLLRVQAALTFLTSGVLLVSASVHRIYLDDPIYTDPTLVGFVMLPLILLLALFAINLSIAVIFLFRQKYKKAGWAGLLSIVAIAVFIAAMALDSPTVLYIT